MMFPEEFNDLLQDDTKAIAILATLMPDGTPQVTPLWFNSDGEFIYLNSAEGRVKDRNMEERRDVALVLIKPGEPNRYMQVRGKVVEITKEGAETHIHALSQKHRGRDWDIPEGQVRKMYTIKPKSVSMQG